MKSFIVRLFFIVILLFSSTVLPAYAQEYGSLKIIPPTEDCEVIIDGIQVGTGTTTAKIKEGTHNVVVNLKDGTPIYNKTVEIVAQEVKTIPISYELKNAGSDTQLAKPKPVSPSTPASSSVSAIKGKKTKYYLEAVNHSDNTEYSGGVGFDGGALFGLSPNNYIDVWASYYSGNTKVKTLSKGTLGFISANIGYLGERKNETTTLYFGAGISYYQFSNEVDKSLTNYAKSLGYRYEEWLDNGYGFYGKVGIFIDVSEETQFDVGIKYLSLNPTANAKLTDLILGGSIEGSAPMNLSHIVLSLGLVY